jgi:ubiquinone/menaquinone biosynthesis C-methylase UbiE
MTAPNDDPQARKSSVAGIFDRSADTYDQVGVDFFAPAGRELVRRADVRPGQRVLDVGCGRGAVLFPAAEAVGPDGAAVGIDLAPRMVELTRQAAAERGLTNVTVAVGDAEQPDFPAESFDAVLAGLVLFFLPDPSAALRRYADILRPGGRLACTTFGANDPVFEATMSAIGASVPGGITPRDSRQGPFGSPDGIREVLTSNGFGDVTVGEVIFESHFADADHWLTWAWSHGGRASLERVPADALTDAVKAAKAEFENARTAAGDYVLRTEFRFTVAHQLRG